MNWMEQFLTQPAMVLSDSLSLAEFQVHFLRFDTRESGFL